MTATDITGTRGAEMFARYAYAPNQLGYCGPHDSRLLTGSREEIEKAARQFTGAWPYLEVLSRGLGVMDATSIAMCRDNHLPIIVFNLNTEGNILRMSAGETVGTLID